MLDTLAGFFCKQTDNSQAPNPNMGQTGVLPTSLIAPSVSLRHLIARGDNKCGDPVSNFFILQGSTG